MLYRLDRSVSFSRGMNLLVADVDRARIDNPWLPPEPATYPHSCDGMLFGMTEEDQRRLVLVPEPAGRSLGSSDRFYRH